MATSLSFGSLPSSSSSSSLMLITCLGSVIAFGSVFIFVRGIFNPQHDDGDGGNTVALERLGLNIGLGINRFRLDLNLLFVMRPQERIFDLHVRIGGGYPPEIAGLLLLLFLRSQAAPILMPLLEDIECAAVWFLTAMRRPRLALLIL
ncbi:uncharacterized protein LOC127801728 [Diospyros lotus]|uniref:uncharacterized protein LOC127801728 n=1 Tax=Diospyros lotus TaxID=55363 RepID=UPI0022539F84|nr:uncharacterized protein LOC127801728 [Diospyros lotus]XP_052193056.1 uncharacterized protein LOC127801728 [Diospyros lotus]